MSIVEVEGVLSVVLDSPDTLRLSLRVVEVLRLEILLVLVLVVRKVAACLDRDQALLEERPWEALRYHFEDYIIRLIVNN